MSDDSTAGQSWVRPEDSSAGATPFERRQPTAAEVAHGLGLEVDLLHKRIAELEASLQELAGRYSEAQAENNRLDKDKDQLLVLVGQQVMQISRLEAQRKKGHWQPVVDLLTDGFDRREIKGRDGGYLSVVAARVGDRVVCDIAAVEDDETVIAITIGEPHRIMVCEWIDREAQDHD